LGTIKAYWICKFCVLTKESEHLKYAYNLQMFVDDDALSNWKATSERLSSDHAHMLLLILQ